MKMIVSRLTLKLPLSTLIFWGCYICLQNVSPTRAESLPETVKRHEEEIISLKNAMETLRRAQQSMATQPKEEAPLCIKDFSVVGRHTIAPALLTSGTKIVGTDIFLKHIRFAA